MSTSRPYKIEHVSRSLWNRLREGEKSALGKLFKLYFQPLYDYGYRIVSDSEEVKDAIQDVFFQLWKSRERLGDIMSVRGYLFASLRRQLLKQSASHSRWLEINRKYVAEEFDPILNYEEWMEILEIEREQKKALQAAVESLTTRQKEAVYLKFFEGLSNDELARVMKLKKQSIYNLVSEAVESLRSFLDKK